MLTPIISTSEYADITGTAALFATEMAPGEIWIYTCTVASYIKQGDEEVVASAATGSMYVPANYPIRLEAGFAQGERLSSIRASGSGAATLTQHRDTDAADSGVTA